MKVASIQYAVTVENQTITLNSDEYPKEGILEIYPGDSPNASQYELTGPLGGLSWTFGQYWVSDGYLFQIFDDNTNTTFYGVGTEALPSEQYALYNEKDVNNCVYTWKSPTHDLLDSARQLVFRASLHFAHDNDSRTLAVAQNTPVLVYESGYSWLAVAIAIMVISSLSCISLLWGCWELGRKVTLDPIETTKAFNVPRLRVADFGLGVKDLVKDAGELQVQYVQVIVRDAAGNAIPSMELRHFGMGGGVE